MTTNLQSNIRAFLAHQYGALSEDVMKADEPVLSTTSGYFNAVFGAIAFSQFNMSANTLGVLPKRPWQKSGYRAVTAEPGSAGDGGLAEGATVPETRQPTIVPITVTLKEASHTFEESYKHQLLAQGDDDVIGKIEFLRGYFASLHAKRVNQQLLIDCDTLASAGNTFESIDRVTASTAYVTAVSYDAGDEDIYGINRSANSWADAVVNHNSGTDRPLSDDIISQTLSTVEENGGNTNVIITGSDTMAELRGLYQDQVRYPGTLEKGATVQVGINGVQTDEGLAVGKRIATLYGIPVIVDPNVAKDTISRMYLLDTTENADGTPRLFLAIAQPTMYFESGMENPFVNGKFTVKGGYYTAGELVCTFFKAQASIRDLA